MSVDYTVAIGYKVDSTGLTNAQAQADKVNASLKSSTASAEKLGEEIGSKLKDAIGGVADEAGVFGEVLSSIGPIGLALAASLGAVAIVVDKIVDGLENAQKINDLSRNTGANADALNTLQAAAISAGTEANKANAAFGQFSVQLEKASEGNAKAAISFNQLGLSASKLKGLDPYQAFYVTLEKLQGIDNFAEKQKILNSLFGEANADVTKLTESNKNYADSLEELSGLKFSPEVLSSAKELDEASDGLKAKFAEVGVALTNAFGPDIASSIVNIDGVIKNFLDNIIKEIPDAKKFFEDLYNQIQNNGEPINDSFLSSTITDLQNIGGVLKSLGNAPINFFKNLAAAANDYAGIDLPDFSNVSSGSAIGTSPKSTSSPKDNAGNGHTDTKADLAAANEEAKQNAELLKEIDKQWQKIQDSISQSTTDADAYYTAAQAISNGTDSKQALQDAKDTSEIEKIRLQVNKDMTLYTQDQRDAVALTLTNQYLITQDSKEQVEQAKQLQNFQKQIADFGKQLADSYQESALIQNGTLSTTQQIQHYEEVRLETEKLLNDAKKDNQSLDEDTAKALAEASVTQKEALTKQKQQVSDIDQYIKGVNEQIASGLADAIADGLASGKLDFKGFLADLGKYLVQSGLKALFNSLFSGPSSGGGGIFGTLINGIIGYFAGGSTGQYGDSSGGTGPGTGGGSGQFNALGGAFYHGDKFFASGGLVNGRTKFGMNGGTGIMGEAGPEAIMPLVRGSNGKLGVASSGSQGNTVVINNTVNVSGADDPQKTADASTKALNKLIEQKVISVISDQRRSGNQLNPPIQTYQ